MRLQRTVQRGTILPGIILGLVIGLAIAAFIAWTWNREPSYNERVRAEQERAHAEKDHAKLESSDKQKEAPLPDSKSLPTAQKTDIKPEDISVAKADKPDKRRAGKEDVSPQDKERFDFYKILPGIEEARPAPDDVKKQERAGSTDAVEDKDTEASIEDNPKPKEAKETKKKKRNQDDENQLDQLISKIQGDGKEAGSGAVLPTSGVSKRWMVQAGAFETEDEAEHLKADLAMSGFSARIAKARDAHDLPIYRVRLGPFRSEEEVGRIRSELRRQGLKVGVIPLKENR